MTESEIYQYFQSLINKRKKLIKMKARIELHHARCDGAVSALNLDNGNTRKSVNNAENRLIELLNTTMEYENELEEYVDEKKEFFNFISVLHDEELEAILICRYILGTSTAEIAKTINMHRNSVYFRTERAVKILAQKSQNIPKLAKTS